MRGRCDGWGAFGETNPKGWEISEIKTILAICIKSKKPRGHIRSVHAAFSMRCILVVEYFVLLVEELLAVLDVDLALQQVLGLATAEVVDGV